MEINITKFFEEGDHFAYSHSQAEGGPSAGRDSWNAAKERAGEEPHLLTSDEAREQWRADLRDMGYGDGEDITRDPVKLEALLIQYIAGDIREMYGLCGDDWEEYQALSEQGTVSSRLFRDDDGEVYYCLGS